MYSGFKRDRDETNARHLEETAKRERELAVKRLKRRDKLSSIAAKRMEMLALRNIDQQHVESKA